MDNKKRKPEDDNIDDAVTKKAKLERLHIILQLEGSPHMFTAAVWLSTVCAKLKEPCRNLDPTVRIVYTDFAWPSSDPDYLPRSEIRKQVQELFFVGSMFSSSSSSLIVVVVAALEGVARIVSDYYSYSVFVAIGEYVAKTHPAETFNGTPVGILTGYSLDKKTMEAEMEEANAQCTRRQKLKCGCEVSETCGKRCMCDFKIWECEVIES